MELITLSQAHRMWNEGTALAGELRRIEEKIRVFKAVNGTTVRVFAYAIDPEHPHPDGYVGGELTSVEVLPVDKAVVIERLTAQRDQILKQFAEMGLAAPT